MNIPKPSVIIFDMDGTTVRHINPRLLHLMEWLDDASFRIAKFFGWLFRRGAKGPIVPELNIERHSKSPKLLVHRAIHKFRRRPVEQIVEPCPGVYSLLSLLEKHDIPLGLVSNGLGQGYGHDILKKFDLGRFFSATVFCEDIRHSKPNPEPILLALQRLDKKLTPDDVVWYIGDRHKDITAALAAENHVPCRVVPIAYALNAAVAVLDNSLNPDHIIMSYQDMYRKLDKALGKPKKPAKDPSEKKQDKHKQKELFAA